MVREPVIFNNDLLLVIDMQNVYLPGQEWACPSIIRSSGHIRTLLDSGRIRRVLFTRYIADEHAPGRWQEYNRAYRHINEDPWMSEIIDDLKPYAAQYPMIVKSTYSSLKDPSVQDIVRRADHVLLAGVVAECCVLATMMDAIDLGAHVCYLKDCISGQNDEYEERVCAIAQGLEPVHVRVTDSSSYLAGL